MRNAGIMKQLPQKAQNLLLVKKYRGRDQVEVDFKDMKGILDLERIIYQRPERIDAYIFLKIIAYFMFTFFTILRRKSGDKDDREKNTGKYGGYATG